MKRSDISVLLEVDTTRAVRAMRDVRASVEALRPRPRRAMRRAVHREAQRAGHLPALQATPGNRSRPTRARGFGAPDHRPPSGKHARGREQALAWRGTSRMVQPAERARRNKRSWRKIVADARREVVADQRRQRAVDVIAVELERAS
jgi:hypothetical protein